jgi:hypothetical protein
MRIGCCLALAFLAIDFHFAPACRHGKPCDRDSTPAERGAPRFLQSDAF